MFSKIGELIFENEAVSKTSDFKMGLEVEMHRVDGTGNLSEEPYPAAIGDQKINPWITNDFLETMSEVVTPAASNALDAMHYLYSINTALRTALSPGEFLWPLSMPPKLTPERIKIAQAGSEKERYFKEWLKHHRVAEGAPCGAHINLSIDERLITMVYQKMPERFADEKEVRNYLYTIVAQGFVRYRWLLTYLFGASPIAEGNYFETGKELTRPVRSLRQSREYGFGSKFTPDYTDLEHYVQVIERAVAKKEIYTAAQFHGPVRFKGATELKQLQKEGIAYLELRMLDLDPTSYVGIRTGTLRFIRLLASYFIMSPALNKNEVFDALEVAERRNELVALEDPTKPSQLAEAATALIEHLKVYIDLIQAGPEYQELIEDMEYRVKIPMNTPSARLVRNIKDGSLTEYALKRAKGYQKSALLALHPFRDFEDHAKLSANELKAKLFRGSWEPQHREEI